MLYTNVILVNFLLTLSPNVYYISFAVILGFLIVIFFLTICGYLTARIFFFALILFYIYYWLNSTFMFLYKKSQFSIYVTSIQRFWKRSLNLFWLIEFFLFSIYLYLFLISPQEVMYMHDNLSATFSYLFNLTNFFNNLLILLLIILVSNVLLLFIKFDSLKYLILVIIFSLLIFALQNDFFQYFAVTQFYNNINWVFDFSSNLWQLEFSTIKTRTIIHYFYLLIFLKFWHTIFIVGFFIFFYNIFLHLGYLSFGIFSGNMQNFFFLFFFGFILKIITLKYYLNYIYEYVYFWFFQDFHFFDNNFFFQILVLKPYYFLIYDLKFSICYFF